MKVRLAIVSLFILVTISLSWAGDAAKDQKALQGSWIYVKGDEKGEVTFAGNKFTVVIGDETYKGSFKIDPGKKPSTIDMKVTEAKKFEGQTSLGIYKLEGDKLTWCANEPGREERPTEFAEKLGDRNLLLVVMERKKK